MCSMTCKINNKMPGVILEHQKAVNMRGLAHSIRAIGTHVALTLPKSNEGYIMDVYHWISRAASGYPFTFFKDKIALCCNVILWNRVGGSSNDHACLHDVAPYHPAVHFSGLASSGGKS